MGIFIDKRLDMRFHGLCKAMQVKQSVIIRQLANERSEEVAYGRFINNLFVSPRQMIKQACQRTAQNNRGKDVLLLEDTSTLGFGLYRNIENLSPIGDGRGRGFYLHPVLSLDARTGDCLGLASAQLFHRKVYQGSKAQQRNERNRQHFNEKESYRWYEEIAQVVKYGGTANSYTVVADREADIYELLLKLSQLEVDFVIRSFQNRLLYGRKGPNLKTYLASQPVRRSYKVKLPATDKRSAHTAELEVKWCQAVLARPHSGTGTKHLAATHTVTVVDVQETSNSVVGKEKPIHWRLLTSHEVSNLKDAQQVIQYYTQRWVIEQFFRVLKKKGLDIYSAQVQNAHALENLTALCLINIVQVIQLVQARNKPEGLSIKAGFDSEAIALIHDLNPALEGNSALLKNPNPKSSLAYASWVIARLGGWSGYTSQRTPGPITMWNGLKRFNDALWINRLTNKKLKSD